MKIYEEPSLLQFENFLRSVKRDYASEKQTFSLYYGDTFPPDIDTYLRSDDLVIFAWVRKATRIFLLTTLKKLPKKELKLIASYIVRCCREILYNKIISLENQVLRDKLQCMAVASLSLAIKTILQHDHLRMRNVIYFLAGSTEDACTASEIAKMEADLIKTEGWIPCKTVMDRMPIHEREADFSEHILKTVISPFLLFPDEHFYLRDNYFK